ncbi:MAG: hypothetical protein KDD47_27200 [Acidobacteria bacterium]|nr:hypothetical protein [Acidobacteriota bacterium]
MKKALLFVSCLALLLGAGLAFADHHEGSWTGEVIDIACYVPKGAQGEGHSACAKSCVKNGQPMGLLTDDGSVVLLAADHADGAAFEGLKDLAGSKAEVSGHLADKGGIKVLTVTAFKAAG